MYCSREYQLTSRFIQQYEKSTSNKKCIFFVGPEDEDALLGMSDIKLLNILQINYNTIGTKKEEKSTNSNQNKRNTINVGSEQWYTNTGL